MTRKTKSKLIYLLRILQEMTDDEHGLSTPELIEELGKYEINIDRKTLYDDIDTLNDCGYDIVREQVGAKIYYHMVSRSIEEAELKLLVDIVQSSKMITENKTRSLIERLEQYTSCYIRKDLNRDVYVSGRIKTMNESVFYNIDAVHRALNQGKKLKFQYFTWNREGKKDLKHDGKYYLVNPIFTVVENERYYLVASEEGDDVVKHFRIDKMLHITVADEDRDVPRAVKKLDPKLYAQQHFKMVNGEQRTVTLECKNWFANIIVDQFGAVMMIPKGKDKFRVNVDVAISDVFYSWAASNLGDMKIVAPREAVDGMKDFSQRLAEVYK